MAYMLNRVLIQQLIETSEVKPLDSETQIEDCIVAIEKMGEKLDFLKHLKKDRVKTIDQEIDKVESKQNQIKSVILETLKDGKLKSLDFPGVGRVVSRKVKGKWVVKDEKLLMSLLSEKLKPDEYKEITKNKETFSKKDLDVLLEKIGEEKEISDHVEKTKDGVSLKVSFYEAKQVDVTEEPVNEEDVDVNSFDGLNF